MNQPPRNQGSRKPRDTSWNAVSSWYDKSVGKSGTHYHKEVILPALVPLMNLNAESKVLDLGCGQGILSRSIPKIAGYLGIDSAKDLIQAAKGFRTPGTEFSLGDVTKIQAPEGQFSHAVFLLSLQNMENPEAAILKAGKALIPKGELYLVLNHPCFRIPRQSGWGVDEQNHQRYRKVYRYMTSMEIPITAHPSQEDSALSHSFHFSLTRLFNILELLGFSVNHFSELVSDKSSGTKGRTAKLENMSRAEIPLFVLLRAVRVT